MIAGAIAGKMFKSVGDDPKLDLVVGLIGAVLGGVLAGVLGAGGVSTFNPWSMAMAAAGATGVLVAWHTFRSFTAGG